jgi:hypothetical protein
MIPAFQTLEHSNGFSLNLRYRESRFQHQGAASIPIGASDNFHPEAGAEFLL